MESNFERIEKELISSLYDMSDQKFLTINYLKLKRYPLDHVLTYEDKVAIRMENEGKDVDYSYVCLMNEMLNHSTMTVRSLIEGWGGVRVFKV